MTELSHEQKYAIRSAAKSLEQDAELGQNFAETPPHEDDLVRNMEALSERESTADMLRRRFPEAFNRED